jgi:diguanylate cyclase (GGDEF)-like protein
MGYIDHITHIPNNKFFEYRLRYYIQSVKSEGVLALLDIDQLNAINQKHGWEKGDDVLRKVCQEIQANLRVKDIIARWEGSSLAVLMPSTAISDALHFLDKIRIEVAKLKNIIDSEPNYSTTISIGCSRILFPRLEVSVYINQAKSALQKAKSEGKNKMLIYGFYSG